MSGLGMMDERTRTRFDRICGEAKGNSGPGLTLTEIDTAGSLARELSKGRPDSERVALFCERLGLTPEEVR